MALGVRVWVQSLNLGVGCFGSGLWVLEFAGLGLSVWRLSLRELTVIVLKFGT